jgi:UDP-N-acetylmuramoyl-L-alanyl-D-glutamate--2,6-diaminopimelate ligase
MAHSKPRSLQQIILELPDLWAAPLPSNNPVVTGIYYDSRRVQPGGVFFALQGESVDGHRYIPQAIQNGAVAVVGTQPAVSLAVPYIHVRDAREAMAWFSAGYYGFPARKLTVIGITGTDGKTTTTSLLYQILLTAGLRAGMISTVSAVIDGQALDTGFHVTTPEAPDVQRYLAQMVDAGLTHVVLESTSHGLAQHRVTACEFDIAVVTNITHEHLDYHGTYEAYRAAKARLFQSLMQTAQKPHGNVRLAVLNKDDHSFLYLNEETEARKVSYSQQPGSDVYATDIHMDVDGLAFTIHYQGKSVPVRSVLVGRYNVSNILAAFTAAVEGLGIPPQIAADGIADLPGVPGRSERIQLGQTFIAMVDFAHTPNALERELETAREMAKGMVIAVFGSAGLRDRAKRRMMAECSARLADITILTAEDPRTESLDDILAEMTEAAVEAGAILDKDLYSIPDRGEALRIAVQLAQPGDIVVACGKGHEQSMCFGVTEFPWDDRIAMRAALSELLGIPGPSMPALPTS